MKPFALTMQAFGSYGKKTTIDFRETNQNLFLITGDTGAGKTTIFDAIVFALYGEASSGNNKKSGMELQSQFVDYAISPYVELTFSEQGQVYRVRRVPRHIRPAKRGKGVTDEKESVSLILPDDTEYPSNKKGTDQKLVDLIGLTKDQFMQIGMIAQGEFMELLRAKTDDKKAIFRKLFHTEIYEQLVLLLRSKCNEMKQEMASIRVACQTELGHVVIPSDQEDFLQLKQTILQSDRFSITRMEEFIERLEKLNASMENELSGLHAKVGEAATLRDEKRDAYTKAETIAKAFRQLEEAEAALAQYHKEEPDIIAADHKSQEIIRAYEISGVYQVYDKAKKAVKELEESKSTQRSLLPSLEQAAIEAGQAEEGNKAALDEETRRFNSLSVKVEAALKAFQALEKDQKEYGRLEKVQIKKEEDSQTAAKTLSDYDQELGENRREADQLKDARLAYQKLQQAKNHAGALYRAINQIKNQEKECKEQADLLDQARADYVKARDIHQKAWKEYQEKQNAYLDAQAGILARDFLKEGQPCPVCGSLDHPRPHYLPDHLTILSREELEELRSRVDKLRADQEEKAGAASSARKVLDEKIHQREEGLAGLYEQTRQIAEELGMGADGQSDQKIKTFADVKAFYNHLALRIRQNQDKILSDKKRLEELEEKLKGADEKKKSLEQVLEEKRKAREQGQLALTALAASMEEKKNSLEYRSAQQAKDMLDAARKTFDQAQAAYQHAKNAASAAKFQKDNALALIKEYDAMLPGKIADERSCQAAYEENLNQKGLTQSQWMSLTTTYARETAEELKDKVGKFREEKSRAEGALKNAKEATRGQEKPDLSLLEAGKWEAEAKYTRLSDLYEEKKHVYKTNKDAFDALAPKMEERGKVMARHLRLDSLYQRLSGNVSGSRMDIETYVQRYYLERILDAANVRFSDMSGGQFALRMYDIEKAGEGKNKGLDLMVYSNVTGKEREIRTLSGGESFMAALSLALGMADQIQENSAAIQLDMMFIDEGFGSLDDHSRNQAVRVLSRMAGGSKLIGIISHVSELKNEIDDQLIITKDEEGSHHRWINS